MEKLSQYKAKVIKTELRFSFLNNLNWILTNHGVIMLLGLLPFKGEAWLDSGEM